jgi:hypothetical protein
MSDKSQEEGNYDSLFTPPASTNFDRMSYGIKKTVEEIPNNTYPGKRS